MAQKEKRSKKDKKKYKWWGNPITKSYMALDYMPLYFGITRYIKNVNSLRWSKIHKEQYINLPGC